MKKIIGILLLILSFNILGATTKAPNFTGKNQYGVETSLDNFKGKFIILTFWATWCPACRHELPSIDELYNQYGENKKDVVFLGVSNEKESTLKDFLTKKGYYFPTVASQDAFTKYPVRAFPTMFIIDKEGNIINYSIGAIPKETLSKYIDINLLQKTF